ncbi:cysteine hydrolase family protein [Halobacillus sp. A5]|uniref:cysteine hydrolase family protein n=1 Tax=Halobacillus sp. A5 TaxID=2880263 RepID=UPI0020A67286|nr:isochorismatase family cysteine hydrolase [Halobacillus sp. A5]MCP3027405.1 cysteine hydrolase [Halobacillus sp. A5]
MEKALIVIDYTCDFVADDGTLTCGDPGQNIESNITSLTKSFLAQEEYVVFAVDVHEEGDPYHPETHLFPPHNIRGTHGRTLYGGLQEIYESNSSSPHVLHIDKTRYSAFSGTQLDLKLRERGITELHLTGVCTDICILHTAVEAYNLGYNIVVHKNAVASFNQTGHEWALEHFENVLGATVK